MSWFLRLLWKISLNFSRLPTPSLACVCVCVHVMVDYVQATSTEGKQTWNWGGFTRMDDICMFSHDIPKATFTRKPSKLSDIVTWLEQNQKVRMTCDMHVMVKKGKVWSIKSEKQFVYKLLGLDESHKEKPSDQNAGSLLKASRIQAKQYDAVPRASPATWANRRKRHALDARRRYCLHLEVSDVMKDPRLIIRPRIRYVTKRNAFENQRPGIYLKEPTRVRKGMWLPFVTPETKK